MRSVFWVVLVAASASLAASQRPVTPPVQPGPASSALRPQEVPVAIEGCLHGRTLKPLQQGLFQGTHEEVLRATEFLLEGSKELMQQLARDHDGHHEEITGIAIIPASPAGEVVDTRSREIGGVRIFGGVRQTGVRELPGAVAAPDSPRPIRIEVKAAAHVAETCVSRK